MIGRENRRVGGGRWRQRWRRSGAVVDAMAGEGVETDLERKSVKALLSGLVGMAAPRRRRRQCSESSSCMRGTGASYYPQPLLFQPQMAS